jgi:hypothetical protein
MIGANTMLKAITDGRRMAALSERRGIKETVTAPIPNGAALTTALNRSAIENLVVIDC